MTQPPITLCRVYRSERKQGAYLYTRFDTSADPLAELPEELLRTLGELTEVMTLKLHAQRKLANADVNRVIAELANKGFYLQLPPLERNTKAAASTRAAD